MRTTAFLPGGGMWLCLLGCCLLLVGSDLGFVVSDAEESEASGWVRFVRDGREGRFCRIRIGESFVDFLAREMPGREVLPLGSCAGLVLESGTEIHWVENGWGWGAMSCRVSSLPERIRYFLGLPMNINRAEMEELTLIPGIGERLAGRIQQKRQEKGGFKAREDLLSIPGIGTKLLDRIRRHATVDP
jgi:competence ComEA-like helix-hairpin-helix protein